MFHFQLASGLYRAFMVFVLLALVAQAVGIPFSFKVIRSGAFDFH